MEDTAAAADAAPNGQVSLLDVQSEQLALKLQKEVDGEVGESPMVTGDTSGAGAKDGEADTQTTIPESAEGAAQNSNVQKSAPQGAWGTLGRSFADLLRPKASAESQESQRGSASAPSSSNDLSAVPLDPSAVGTMIGMGIEETWAAAALRRCGGSDVIRAVEFCFSHDMAALAEEDKALEAASRPDVDSDMAFAMALDQEERRVFNARRSAAAAEIADEQGAFGSKIRVASVTGAHAGTDAKPSSASKPKRWGADDADAYTEGDENESSPGYDSGGNDGDDGAGEGDEEGGELSAIPGGGRRKGKMPLFRNSAGELVSKHDTVICGRMNARDASNFEGVGDLTAAGVRLSNRTFNSLKRDIRKKKEKGMAAGERVEGATRSTQEGVMDPRTRLLLLKMVNASTLLEVHGMVKTGKEAHVYHALAPEDPEALTGSRGVALKIFKTTLNEFGNRAAYVDGDPRYGHMKFNKQSRQKMFAIWAKKEHRNLIRLHRSGIPCPEPISQREHTLVMSFIGAEHWPAPQLRELDLSSSNWRRCYAQVLELMRVMYQRCHLVHADLSEYNILYHEKVCYVIDVGQAVDTGHVKAREYLSRDIAVTSSFFTRQGVKSCLDQTLAEQFVLGYAGPSHLVDGGGSHASGAAAVNEEPGSPPNGVAIVTELMGLSVEEGENTLRKACEAAEPWAAARASASKKAGLKKNGKDEDNDDDEWNDGIDDVDDLDDDLHGNDGDEIMVDPSLVRDDDLRGQHQADPSLTEGWTVVDAEEGNGEDGEDEAFEAGDTEEESRGKGVKVELGERERARMADQKEALKAGIYGETF